MISVIYNNGTKFALWSPTILTFLVPGGLMEMCATCIRVPPLDLKSHTRLVRLRGRTSLRDRFSGTFRDPALSNEVLPPELLESSVSYSCGR